MNSIRFEGMCGHIAITTWALNRSFGRVLDSIAKELSDLRAKKGWKQAITHDHIKGVLQECETKIDRSSRTLQVRRTFIFPYHVIC